jgi:hypothetical protein
MTPTPSSKEMTDENIEAEIMKDMINLAMHEAGTKWMRTGTLLSMNATNQMLGAGFKALIIRQNELNRRLLQRIMEKLT